EIEMALAAGATPDRSSYGNTIKKERDIARAFALGMRLFAVDCAAEVEKIARAAPGAKVFCRILYDCAGAEWPLSRKFGCDPEMAVEVLDLAKKRGLEPVGISFHVGSQQRKVKAWDRALAMASTVFRDCAERGINLSMVNLGGLAETMDESIRYAIKTKHDGAEMTPCVLAGPTCDSADVLYEKNPYPLPVTLEIGDKVLIEGTGAYTSTYSSVAFNGIPPL